MRIYYSDEEWDKLTSVVYTMRINNPLEPLTTLVNRAVMQMPEDRRRLFTVQNIQPIVDRLVVINQQTRSDAESWRNNRQRLLTPITPEVLMSNISDTMLLAEVRRRMERVAVRPAPAPVAPAAATQAQAPASRCDLVTPSRTVITTNMLPSQYARLKAKLPEEKILLVKDNSYKIPESADLYVSWGKFSSHSLRDRLKATAQKTGAKFCDYTGGTAKLPEFIRQRL